MDLRQYTVSETPGPEILAAESGAPQRRYVRLDPKPPDADVQAMVDEGAVRMAEMNTRLGTYLWGVHAFNREKAKYDASRPRRSAGVSGRTARSPTMRTTHWISRGTLALTQASVC